MRLYIACFQFINNTVLKRSFQALLRSDRILQRKISMMQHKLLIICAAATILFIFSHLIEENVIISIRTIFSYYFDQIFSRYLTVIILMLKYIRLNIHFIMSEIYRYVFFRFNWIIQIIFYSLYSFTFLKTKRPKVWHQPSIERFLKRYHWLTLTSSIISCSSN